VNLLDRAIAWVAPRTAVARAQARRILGAYEAAEPSRLRKAKQDARSANNQNDRAAIPIRLLARNLEQNSDIAKGALDVLVANVVGTGIVPEPQIELASGEPAEEINRELLRLWDDWIYSPEVTRQFDYYSLQRTLVRSWLRDGEVFAQRLIGSVPGLDHNTLVPFSLEALEADLVPFDLLDKQRGITQGIETDAWGRPRAFWVYKQHPGDAGGSGAYTGVLSETKRVSADRVMHLKLTERLHQLRGVSVFHSVLNRLDDIKEIDESERVAARVAASMAAFIKKGTPDFYSPPLDQNGQPIPVRSMEMAPGMIFDDLQPGEEIGTIDTNRPNNALIPFRDSQLRSAAAGLGAGYSSISKNYVGSYSSQRQELVETFVHYRMLTHTFVFRVCQPVWDSFIDAAVAAGVINLTGINPATLYNCSHSLPPMPWIDPEKEVAAAISAIENGLTSRSRVIRQRGDNPDQINQEIKRDQDERARLGIELDKDRDARLAQEAAAEQTAAHEEAAGNDADAQAAQARAQANAFKELGKQINDGLRNMPKAETHVAAPVVNVGAPVINVPEQATPVVNVAAPTVTVEAPAVSVAAPEVTVRNEIPTYEETESSVIRDDAGNLLKTVTKKRRRN
jgi:lambda family phage portal protein